jgi:ubiquinone/menaquinone biosynthesis C-methylase UbiE
MGMFQDASYAAHVRDCAEDAENSDRKEIFDSWFDTTTADAWRHARGYEIADYLGGVPGEKWLTVGDGRFGLDAIRLKDRGASEVLPTNLDGSFLKIAKDRGLISDYGVENAERLSYADAPFDYAFCKEAYHHFPRPMIALYEMLRVTRKGVILFEPFDRRYSPLRLLKRGIKKLLGAAKGHIDFDQYEVSGNYIYSISERDIEKVALGINLPQIAFKTYNDAYVHGQELVPATFKSSAYRKMRFQILKRDILEFLGIEHPEMMAACLFHQPVTAEQRTKMKRNGWKIVDLPKNPYL